MSFITIVNQDIKETKDVLDTVKRETAMDILAFYKEQYGDLNSSFAERVCRLYGVDPRFVR